MEGLTEVETKSVEDVLSVMRRAGSNRVAGAHNMNEHSSRSHLVVSIVCEGVNAVTTQRTRAKLNLIDLAGSERVSKTDAQGARLKEAQSINKSLSALGDVVNSLSAGNKHVPYRNSKLTFLLQEALSGNSKVLMFVNISPAVYNVGETICSLKFAERCNKLQLGQAKRNADGNEVLNLRKEVADLRDRLSQGGAASGAASPAPRSGKSSQRATPR